MADPAVAPIVEPGFTPEPVPDAIADTELTGLHPDEDSTESEPVEDSQDETSNEPSVDPKAPEAEPAADEDPAALPAQTEPEKAPEAVVSQDTQEQVDAKELAARRFAERQQQRDYINEERAKIREAEQVADPTDTARRLEILEAKQYVDTIERNRTTLQMENTRATNEIPLFNPNDKSYQPVLYERAIQRFNDAFSVLDPETNEVIGAQDRNGNTVSLYQYLQQEAAGMSEVLGVTQRQTQQSEAKMRAKVTTPTNPGKVTSSGDELQDLLDKVGDIPLN